MFSGYCGLQVGIHFQTQLLPSSSQHCHSTTPITPSSTCLCLISRAWFTAFTPHDQRCINSHELRFKMLNSSCLSCNCTGSRCLLCSKELCVEGQRGRKQVNHKTSSSNRFVVDIVSDSLQQKNTKHPSLLLVFYLSVSLLKGNKLAEN